MAIDSITILIIFSIIMIIIIIITMNSSFLLIIIKLILDIIIMIIITSMIVIIAAVSSDLKDRLKCFVVHKKYSLHNAHNESNNCADDVAVKNLHIFTVSFSDRNLSSLTMSENGILQHKNR